MSLVGAAIDNSEEAIQRGYEFSAQTLSQIEGMYKDILSSNLDVLNTQNGLAQQQLAPYLQLGQTAGNNLLGIIKAGPSSSVNNIIQGVQQAVNPQNGNMPSRYLAPNAQQQAQITSLSKQISDIGNSPAVSTPEGQQKIAALHQQLSNVQEQTLNPAYTQALAGQSTQGQAGSFTNAMNAVGQQLTGQANPNAAVSNILGTSPSQYASNLMSSLTGGQTTAQGFANSTMNSLLDPATGAVNTWMNSPLFQNTLKGMEDQSAMAVNNSAAAQNQLLSGRTLNALSNNAATTAGNLELPTIGNTINNVLSQGAGVANNALQQGFGAGNAQLSAQNTTANNIIGAETNTLSNLINQQTSQTNQAQQSLSSLAGVGGASANSAAQGNQALAANTVAANNYSLEGQSNAMLQNANNYTNAQTSQASLLLQAALSGYGGGTSLGQTAGAIGGGIGAMGLIGLLG